MYTAHRRKISNALRVGLQRRIQVVA